MSDIVEHYKDEIARLTKDLEAARKNAAKYRVERNEKLKDAEQRAAAAEAEAEKWKGEHSKIAKKLESLPNELGAEVDRLKGELRTRDHRAKFGDLAREAKVRPDALGDLWDLSGYRAEADEIDEDAMRAAITKAVETRPYLLDGEAVKPAPKAGPAGGKGGKADTPGIFRMSRQQAGDPEFQQANRAAIQAAAASGLLKVE